MNVSIEIIKKISIVKPYTRQLNSSSLKWDELTCVNVC